MKTKIWLNVFVVLSWILTILASTAPIPTAARGSVDGFSPHISAPVLEVPPETQDTMPVFHILPTTVNQDIILNNAARFSGLGATNVFSDISLGGLDHYSAFNPDTGNLVEQYNHGGGLFAVNYGRAYTETEMTFFPTNTEVCNFLMVRELFPLEVEPTYTDCAGDPPYAIQQIHLSTMNPSTGEGTNSIIGELVQVPLAVNIGTIAPDYVPLGGPGGHLSLLLAGSPNTPGLDDILPGLQGIASPWFDRALDPQPIGYYPVVPISTAIERFKARYPVEMQVDAGTPQMIYYVGFPDSPQDAMMPTWTFPNATAIISGTLVNLKETSIPAVDGFAPVVDINSPVNGAVVSSGEHMSVTFNISGDYGPFTYTISSDNVVITQGVMAGGTQTADLGVLNFVGRADGHTLSVHAVNTYHIAGDDIVFLASPKVYLPIIALTDGMISNLGNKTTVRQSPSIPPLNSPDSTLRIGVEWVMDYHNPDSNLALTKADAEGLYTWLGMNGWAHSFNYGNDAAWEKDWRDCSLGGIDCGIGVDRVEFTYFSGHGSPTAWYFGIARDFGAAWGGYSRFQTVRWAAFSSCNTVRAGPYIGPGNPPLTEWFASFQGAYMILGFHSVMADIPFGLNFGFNMRNLLHDIWPWMQPSIAQAWVNTAFAMNAGKPAYLYAVGNFDPSGYKLPPSYAGPLPPLTGIYQYRWVWWDE